MCFFNVCLWLDVVSEIEKRSFEHAWNDSGCLFVVFAFGVRCSCPLLSLGRAPCDIWRLKSLATACASSVVWRIL